MVGLDKFFLHSVWVPTGTAPARGHFFVWAEVAGARKAKGGKSNNKSAARGAVHPFSADKERIVSLFGNSESAGFDASELVISLPSRSYGGKWQPIPSPQLSIISEGSGSGGDETAEFRQWKVGGIVLQPALFLESMAYAEEEQNKVLCDDFIFWQLAARFALRLLAKQKFFPAMLKGGSTEAEYYSVWKPVVEDGEDIALFEELSSSMPPSGGLAFSASAKDLLSHFIFYAVNDSVRRWAGDVKLGAASKMPTINELEEMTTLGKWYSLLLHHKSLIRPYNRDVESFFNSFEMWAEPLRQEALPFRTCFRLEAPEHSDAKWALRFLLQDRSETSLMLDAEEIWREKGSGWGFLKIRNPQEMLLSDLGKASRIFRSLEKSLTAPKPSVCYLSSEEAYQFLSEYSWLFKESGFGVLLPSWWEEKRNKLGIKVKFSSPSDASTGLFGLQSLVSFDWQLAVGESGETLSQEEFEKLAALKVPLVNIRGKWVEIRKEHVQQALKRLNMIKKAGMTAGEALRLSLGAGAGVQEAELPVLTAEASGWFESLLNGLKNDQKINTVQCPKDFKGVLRPYQQKGVSWFAFLAKYGFGACLADDMGLGKTIQMVALLLHFKEKGNALKPTLLFCPTSVIGNWCRELERFAPSLSVHVHHGAERLDAKKFKREAAKMDIVITSYALSHRDGKALASLDWPCIVLDEAQNIKNPFSKQSSAIKGLKAGFRVALTGTPVENRLTELWSIFDFLNPSYLGGYDAFRKTFSIPVERYGEKEAAERLKNTVQPFVLRRLKTDKAIISDLPGKVEAKIFCNLTKEQATLYEAVVASSLEAIESSDGMQRRGVILAALTKLKQVCNHPALFLHDGSLLGGRSGKLERLKEMAEEVLAGGYRALIFTQFSEMGEQLRAYLQSEFGEEVLFLHGGTPRKARDEMVQRFQGVGPRLFVLSLKAGGLGLNLTSASYVFHFDRWWNPAVENQATDRAFRIGQTRNVQVYKFISSGTVEEKIDALIERKKEIADRVIGTGESWITELSTEKLRELFSLREEFVYSQEE